MTDSLGVFEMLNSLLSISEDAGLADLAENLDVTRGGLSS